MAESLRCELFPGDLDAAVRFYVDVLDFELDRDERASSSPYVAMTRSTVVLGLAQRDDVVSTERRRPPAGVELVLEVADLTAAYERVMAAGWPVDEDLTARPWGLVDFRVMDPAGCYWRITTGAEATWRRPGPPLGECSTSPRMLLLDELEDVRFFVRRWTECAHSGPAGSTTVTSAP